MCLRSLSSRFVSFRIRSFVLLDNIFELTAVAITDKEVGTKDTAEYDSKCRYALTNCSGRFISNDVRRRAVTEPQGRILGTVVRTTTFSVPLTQRIDPRPE